MNARSKVLLIAHEFPPFSGGFVMRATKFARYLPDFGWQAVVLTARPEDCYYQHGWSRDPALLTEVAGRAEIHAIASPLERLAARLRGAPAGAANQSPASPASPTRQSLGLKSRLRSLHVFQDQSSLWLPPAYFAALRLARQNQVEAIFTTSPPHWVQLLGLWLHRRTRLPWVSDFRDGWCDNPLFQAESLARQRFERWIERQVIEAADAVLVTSRHIQQDFQRAYPQRAAIIQVLHNGVDPADFPPPVEPSAIKADPVNFVHLGNLGGFRDPASLLQAFQCLLEDGRLAPGEVQFENVGKVFTNPEGSAPLLKIVQTAPVSHAEAIKRMQVAGVLVLIAALEEGEGALTSKIFEYLAARRPILAIIPPTGELPELLRRYPLAVQASPGEPRQVEGAILSAVDLARNKEGLSTGAAQIIDQFNRRSQARQLAALLDRVVGAG